MSIDTVTCGESRVRVKYRFGLTLVLPIEVTDLGPTSFGTSLRTKLSVESVTDFIAVAEGSEGACLSNLKASGRHSLSRSAVDRRGTVTP